MMQRGNRHSNLGAQPLPWRLWWGSARPLLKKGPPSRYWAAHPSSPSSDCFTATRVNTTSEKKRKKTKTQMYIVSSSSTVGSEWRNYVIARCNPAPLVTVWWWLRLRAAALRRWGSDVKETGGLAASSRHNNASASAGPVCPVQSSSASALDQRPPLARHIVFSSCPAAIADQFRRISLTRAGSSQAISPFTCSTTLPNQSSNPSNLGNHHTASAP